MREITLSQAVNEALELLGVGQGLHLVVLRHEAHACKRAQERLPVRGRLHERPAIVTLQQVLHVVPGL